MTTIRFETEGVCARCGGDAHLRYPDGTRVCMSCDIAGPLVLPRSNIGHGAGGEPRTAPLPAHETPDVPAAARTFFVPLTEHELRAVATFGADSLDPDLASAARWCMSTLRDAASLASTAEPDPPPGAAVDGGARPGPKPVSGCEDAPPHDSVSAEGLEPPILAGEVTA